MKTIPIWQRIEREARPKLRYWVPGAAMDPEDLVRDIQEIHKMGYGGVEVVSLNRQEAPENAWGSERWKTMVDVIARTTQELGMSMDLANGPAWPIAMPQITDTDDPAALVELTYGEMLLKDGRYEGPLPERKKLHDAGTPELIACMAYQLAGEHVLVRESYTDLMPLVADGYVRAELPGEDWVLFAFYQQPAAHMVKGTYVIDHFSKAGAQACIDYWEPIFRENPQPSMESLFCDSLEYDVEMEWSRSMAAEFEKLNGYSILPHLPVCGLDGTYPENVIPGYSYVEKEISDAINYGMWETETKKLHLKHIKGE